MNASHLICSTTEGVQIDTNAERCIYIYLISGKVSARRSFQSHHFCAARAPCFSISGKVSARRSFQSHHFCAARAPCFSENIFSESRKFVRRGEFHLARYLVPAAVVVYCTVWWMLDGSVGFRLFCGVGCSSEIHTSGIAAVVPTATQEDWDTYQACPRNPTTQTILRYEYDSSSKKNR